ncbi:MAG TPA: twin-arginine translocase subunit TatC, partial [Planctomycetia bacterium]|nr:twin-arginine translocase subunit TatC [Planctomycetia bacterium]
MAKKTGLDDMFDDGSMTFGEHIEELRRHLWRAIVGVLLATLFTIFFAQYVVKILVAPLEGSLESWHRAKLVRVADQFQKDQERLAAADREKLALDLTLGPEELTRLATLLGTPKEVAESITLHAETEAYRVAVPLAGPMLTLNRPWDIRTMSVPEALVIYFKAALGAAVILSSPWVFFQIYSFVAVGLFAHERRFVRMTLPFCTLLFLVGVAFCYFVMLPVMVKFLLSANDWMGLQPDI